MSIPRYDVLIILDDTELAAGRSHVQGSTQILQEGSARILTAVRPADLAALRAGPGILAVIERTVPDELLPTLDEGEALFVHAWEQQPAVRNKIRPGEGLSWDAPGYDPPDPLQ